MQALYNTYRILLELTPMHFFRKYHTEIDWRNRLIGILGAKGVGKSTLILQHIKQEKIEDSSLYVQADDLYFSSHRLYDLAFHFFSNGGKHLFIDEIHKYNNWSAEIKQIYDQLPLLNIIYSGSSILDLQRGRTDLSRRTREYTMVGLSFREYLNLSNGWDLRASTLDEILSGKVDFPYGEHRPLPYFHQYLKIGYYPFFKEPDFLIKLKNVILQTVEEDIPKYAEMTITSRVQLRKLLYVLAQSAPYKPNFSSLERDLNIRRNNIPDYIDYLEKAKLLSVLKTNAQGNKILQKIDKIYLDNPNLAYAISDSEPNVGMLRETTFLSWMKPAFNIVSSECSDFEIDGKTFEIGGKNKGKKQIKNIAEAFVVKDNIEYAFQNEIPLWMFGFIY